MSRCGQYLVCVYEARALVVHLASGRTVVELATGDNDALTCLCVSPDDAYVCTAHHSLLLRQWNDWRPTTRTTPAAENQQQQTKDEVKRVSKCERTWKSMHVALVRHMCFDASSTLLATASADRTTRIWNMRTQCCTHNLKVSSLSLPFSLYLSISFFLFAPRPLLGALVANMVIM